MKLFKILYFSFVIISLLGCLIAVIILEREKAVEVGVRAIFLVCIPLAIIGLCLSIRSLNE
jgi:hypothetical protein